MRRRMTPDAVLTLEQIIAFCHDKWTEADKPPASSFPTPDTHTGKKWLTTTCCNTPARCLPKRSDQTMKLADFFRRFRDDQEIGRDTTDEKLEVYYDNGQAVGRIVQNRRTTHAKAELLAGITPILPVNGVNARATPNPLHHPPGADNNRSCLQPNRFAAGCMAPKTSAR